MECYCLVTLIDLETRCAGLSASDELLVAFYQDGAPAHRARDTVAFLKREMLDFIPSTLWPPNSSDLNPDDYSIWSVLQVYHSGIITDLQKLKTRLGGLIDEWAQLNQSIVDAAVGQWRRRLCACVSAREAHFGHKFLQC